MSIANDSNVHAGKDIFISYSRRDKPWVDDYLCPLLLAAEVGFAIDEQDFKIGVPLDENIRTLIRECRHTLLVMTPDWVRGKWTHFESELALQDKPDTHDVSILALKLKDCTVPPHIAPRLYLDLCQARARDDEITKLLKQLGVPEEKINKARATVAKKTWWFLIELMTEPQARDELTEVEEMFIQIQQSNDILTKNKKLHDYLQAMQGPLKEITKQWSDPSRSSEQVDWDRASGATSTLRLDLEKLISYAQSICDKVDVNFVDPLDCLADELKSAFRGGDAREFRSCVDYLSGQVERSLPRVNDRIVQHVKSRRMCDLVNKLQTIYELVADIEFIDDVNGYLQQFRSKLDELVGLEQGVHEKVEDHGTLQNTEDSLHLCRPEDEPRYGEIVRTWNKLEKRFVRRLTLTERYGKLLGYADELNEQLKKEDEVRDDEYERSIRLMYTDFVFAVRSAFNKLDIDLLEDCDELKRQSDELGELLRRMKNNDVQ